MKKIFAIILTVAICLSLGTAAFAAEDVLLIAPAPGDGVNAYVTISSEGNLVLTNEPLYVTDLDADGVITINDTLIKAHEEHYVGEGGYSTYISDYGVSLDTLWGVQNGGCYGFYVNDISSWSLSDPIAEGDYIAAYSYVDLESWTDAYTYFDKRTAEAKVGDSLELTLSNPDWSGNILPVAGAVIYVDGVATTAVTDENGKTVVTMDKAGEHIISAKSDTAVLVPPVCVVEVAYADGGAGDDYAAAVEYLLTNGLLAGIADEKFETAGEASRAMAVAILHKSVGSPDAPADFALAFDDIEAAQLDSFRWAAYEGIIEGYGNGKAGPLNKVTREELAVILWRYAKSLGADVSVGENTNILSYNDALDISEWAIPAMQWVCGAGLYEGDAAGNIRPAAEVTCGELAQLLYELDIAAAN